MQYVSSCSQPHRRFLPLTRKLLPTLSHLSLQRPATANHHRPTRLHRTTDTIDGIAAVIAGIATVQASTSWQNQKGGAWRLPLFANLLCRLRSALTARMFRERRAPQERCVQHWYSSKPGGVMSPPELTELSCLGLLSREVVCKRRTIEPENSTRTIPVLAVQPFT